MKPDIKAFVSEDFYKVSHQSEINSFFYSILNSDTPLLTQEILDEIIWSWMKDGRYSWHLERVISHHYSSILITTGYSLSTYKSVLTSPIYDDTLAKLALERLAKINNMLRRFALQDMQNVFNSGQMSIDTFTAALQCLEPRDVRTAIYNHASSLGSPLSFDDVSKIYASLDYACLTRGIRIPPTEADYETINEILIALGSKLEPDLPKSWIQKLFQTLKESELKVGA